MANKSVYDFSLLEKDQIMVILDTETTGFTNRDEIIELAAMKIQWNGQGEKRVQDTFQSLIRVNRQIPAIITQITGITYRDIANQPRFLTVIQDFLQFAQDSTLFVAHNATFDKRMLANNCMPYGIKFPNVPWICSEKFSRQKISVESYKLEALAHELHIPQPKAHRALADVETAYQLLLKLCS